MKFDIINVEMIKLLLTWAQANYAEISAFALISLLAFCWVRADKI